MRQFNEEVQELLHVDLSSHPPNFGGRVLCLHLNPPENRLRIDTERDGEQSQKLEQVPCFGAGEIRPEFEIPRADLPW